MTDLVAFAGAVRAWVNEHRDQMLGLLEQVVDVESPSESREGVDRVAELLAAPLAEIGLAVRREPAAGFADHVVAEGGPADAPRALFVGHMDTVFPVGTGWGFGVRDGRAYGPGVIDMKSGDCVAVFALRALHALGGLPLAVRVFFNTDEEQGSPRTRELMPDLCRDVDCAFVMEPAEANGDIITRRKGAGVFRTTVRGRAAHAGKQPESGVNANLELAHLIVAAEALADPAVGTTVNAGLVRGGVAAAVVAEEAHADFDLRVPTSDEQARVERDLRALAVTPRVAGAAIEVEGFFHRPPMPPLEGAQALTAAVEAAAGACGGRARFGSSGAVSDGNLTVAQGVPTLDGMGAVGGREHSSDEYMELESYFERTAWLAVALRLLADAGAVTAPGASAVEHQR
jgi:glutamate carboxypeptidase